MIKVCTVINVSKRYLCVYNVMYINFSKRNKNRKKNREIKPGIKSDHSLSKITLDLLHTQARGCSYWKFNNTLLKDIDYIEMIKN